MEEYKISVLVTFYNQEKYVDEALNSIFAQKTSFPFQVIIGDDGSDDGTIEKVKAWQSKYPERIRLVIQPRDNTKKIARGVRASRNRLGILRLVDTPYFIYLDGDDYFTDPQKLQKQYEILENPNNKDCIACGHNIRMYNEQNSDKETFIPGKNFKEGKYTLKKYWNTTYFHTNTILFRSNHIKDLKFDIIEDSFNDNLITYSFLQFGKMIFIKDCMADYRQNEQGIWAGEKRYISLIREFLAHDLECKINPAMKEISRKRHFYNFKCFADDHNLFENVGPEYIELARKYDCQTAIRALETKHLFSDDWEKDNRTLRMILLRIRLKQLPIAPYLVVRKLWRMVAR